MGRDRTLTLLYNSAQAVPKPIVAVAVTEGTVAPSQVFVRLSINGVARDSATYGGWSGTTRQIIIAHDGSSDSSGIYPFSILIRNVFANSVQDATISDTLLNVNRKTTLYGTGWSLAGVEELRLNQPGGKILWVGGDGSAKVFRSLVADSIFLGAPGAFRDTLVRFDSVGTSWWRRSLRYGASVTYRVSGSSGQAKHFRTTNRIGNSTFFTWSGDTLKKIAVPPDTTAFYSLVYAAGRLDKITDPAGRILDVTVSSDRLTQIIDPDTNIYNTSFTYDAVGRMLGRTNRRGFTNRFAFGNGLRVTADSIRLDTTAATYGVTTFSPWDEKGLALGLLGNTAVDVANVYTKIDGPRAAAVGDTAEFWVDRWGAPTTTKDPLGNQTTITRSDASNPALVTRVRTADGRIVGAAYDSPRARLLWTADSTFEGTGTTQTVTTSYVYGQTSAPDSPTQVRTPVDTTTFAYDPTLGLTDSVIAPGGIRTKFTYYLSGTQRGLVQTVIDRKVRLVDTTTWTRYLADLTTSFTYDHWGNDSTIISPKGAVTRYEYDSYRRPINAYDPLGHQQQFTYNPFNEPLTTATLDPGPIATTYTYNRTGDVDGVIDPRQVKRSWRHDAAGRVVGMVDDVGTTETRYFGPSGLLDSIRTRSAEVIRHRYDAGGRQVATTYPSHANVFQLPGPLWDPHPHDSTIAGDSILWTYDVAGRPLTATSSPSTVTFTYNKEGTLRSERQVFRNTSGQVVSDVTLRYWYDAGSRRTKFYNGTDTLFYYYGVSGRLSKLKVQWIGASQPPDSFNFFWDALGRRDSLVYPFQVSVSFGYDSAGALRMICSRHPVNNPPADDNLEQRLRFSVNADGLPISRTRWAGMMSANATCAQTPTQEFENSAYAYDARHQAVFGDADTFAYDSSGNRVSSYNGGIRKDTLVYTAHTNRVLKRLEAQGAWLTYYDDPNGSRTSEKPPTYPSAGLRLYFYNAIGQTTGIEENYGNQGDSTLGGPDWCRYDALGRRVFSCDLVSSSGTAVFDGDNVVGVQTFRFVHGPGTDDPLIGLGYAGGSTWDKFFYLSDGAGRLLAFTDTLGFSLMNSAQYGLNGGNQAGAITQSTGFANSRSESPQAPGVSFYRNRYYDQGSGRWTQEDPAGIAGGANLYTYVGNNPVAYTDPFGLCKYINNTEAPCELFLAAYSEVAPGHAEVEASAVATALINRALDNSHNYGYENTGNLEADIVGQTLAPNQVQGRGNGQWQQLQSLFQRKSVVFNPGDAAKLAGVVRGVESAYANRGLDANGSTYWDHPGSSPGQGASEKYCKPITITDTVGTAVLGKCSK
jgi:RHS repeat-associated protein